MDSNQVKAAAVITKTEKSYLPSFVEEPPQQGMLLDAWYKKSVWLWLLSPLSLLFSFFVKLRINSFKWWSYAGSNRGPLECHSSALPAEL